MKKSEPVLQIPIYPLDQQFTSFAKYNDSKSDGKRITIQQLDLWFLQAEIIDYKRVTHTDTGVYFNRFKQLSIDYKTFLIFLQMFCQEKDLDYEEIKDKLKGCGLPGFDKAKAMQQVQENQQENN
ncbi:tubulin polymerization-promoting protein homolog isoform X2 [Aethina tumida]|uniref:tubulin polymerization-promoting protein homolog isoform X2 n=1 Tax=Aethina tumida TaxID=116153 RepID=UPI002148C7C9|nr:tubulin polymerization-promoting protein homolog isoform X2 [Aethina tumida]